MFKIKVQQGRFLLRLLSLACVWSFSPCAFTWPSLCVMLTRMHSQYCLTLCDPIVCSPPDPFVYGILQARRLEWTAISFSRDLSYPGIDPVSLTSPALQADSLPCEPPGKLCDGCLVSKFPLLIRSPVIWMRAHPKDFILIYSSL